MENTIVNSQLDLLVQLTNDLERFILPKNQTIINVNNGVFAIKDVYRRLLKAIEKVEKIHRTELADELDNIYLKLPEGAKSVFFFQKVRKLGDRLTSLRIDMLEAEPLIEDFCKEWIKDCDERAKALNLLGATATHKVKGYEQPTGGLFHPRQHPKACSQSFKCLDLKGVERNLSTVVTEPFTELNTPSAEDMTSIKAAQSTLRLILGMEPFVKTERTLGYYPPNSIRRAIRYMYNLNYMLYDPIDVLINFIRNSVSAQAVVIDSHPNISQGTYFKHSSETAIPSEVKKENDSQHSIPIPILSITPSCKEALYTDLKEYVECDEEGQCKELYDLIYNKIAPKNKIIVTCTVKEFGTTFYETNAIPVGCADILSQQLPTLFLRSDGKQTTEFTSSYLVKTLRPGKKN